MRPFSLSLLPFLLVLFLIPILSFIGLTAVEELVNIARAIGGSEPTTFVDFALIAKTTFGVWLIAFFLWLNAYLKG